jgi:hypothetical protein
LLCPLKKKHHLRGDGVRPEVAGPMTGSAKQSR